MTRNPCTVPGCSNPGIPGLVQGCGKCQYHWHVGVWGKEWADEVERRNSAPPLAQDEHRPLFKWFADRMNSRQHVRGALAKEEHED